MISPLSIFARYKREGRRLAMISLYDAPSAQIACEGGADALLVGDSLGNVILGHANTIPVTMGDMLRHTGAVTRGAAAFPAVPVIADLPFGSYATPEAAVQNAVALMQAGAHGVKMEGVSVEILDCLAGAGVPVMGHLGFTPQSALRFEGIVQGKTEDAAFGLVAQTNELARHGCFGVVLEAMTREVAAHITAECGIPTIGIGAGGECDGQVLVWNDLVGIGTGNLRFVRRYAETRELWSRAARNYVREVQEGQFPAPEHGWDMPSEELENWRATKADWDALQFSDIEE